VPVPGLGLAACPKSVERFRTADPKLVWILGRCVARVSRKVTASYRRFGTSASGDAVEVSSHPPSNG
jgi:hypothetical protein